MNLSREEIGVIFEALLDMDPYRAGDRKALENLTKRFREEVAKFRCRATITVENDRADNGSD